MTTAITNDKAAFTLAFRNLRKRGFFARQNYLCCQSCAWSSIPEEKSNKVVFYHQQDNESFDGRDLERPIHLAWGGDGKEIVEELEKVGFEVEWDGSENKRIIVHSANSRFVEDKKQKRIDRLNELKTN